MIVCFILVQSALPARLALILMQSVQGMALSALLQK